MYELWLLSSSMKDWRIQKEESRLHSSQGLIPGQEEGCMHFMGSSYGKGKRVHGRPDLRGKQRAWGEKWECTMILLDASLKISNPNYLKLSKGFIIGLRSSRKGVAQKASLGVCSLKSLALSPLSCCWLCSVDNSVFGLEKMVASSLRLMCSRLGTNVRSKFPHLCREDLRLVPRGHLPSPCGSPLRGGWGRRAWWLECTS